MYKKLAHLLRARSKMGGLVLSSKFSLDYMILQLQLLKYLYEYHLRIVINRFIAVFVSSIRNHSMRAVGVSFL